MERIEKLRKIALDNVYCLDEFFYHFYKMYNEIDNSSEFIKYGEAFYYAFSNLTPVILDGELIVGEIGNNLTSIEKEEWKNVYLDIANNRCAKAGGGQGSHMAIDYDLLLSLGIKGVIKKIEEYERTCSLDKKDFYKCTTLCLKGVVEHANNYSALAEKLASKETNSKRKNELYEIARICKKVPYEPASSFYEAVQSVHFVSYCISLNPFRYHPQQFQLGHPDRYLYKFYENDIKNGVITKEKAQLLLDTLGIQINMRVPSGLSSGYMVGGRDENGGLVANDLTEMLMQVVDDIKLVYPAVGLCYTKDIPEKYLNKAVEILSKGRSHPAIFNDDVIFKGLVSYGVPEREAHNYIHSTCVEITPVASSNVWVASPYTNLAQLLLDTMDCEYESYTKFVSAFLDRLDTSIKNNFLTQNAYRKTRLENSMNPLLSCFVNDCLERGLDIEKGGARYNWIMPSFVGMANLIDSLYVLKTIVFEKNELGLLEFKKILDNNFEGYEEFHNYISNKIPKYGSDIDEIDSMFGEMTEHIASECEKYIPLLPNGRIIPSVFCWEMHSRFGVVTGATPDGRKKGFPLGDGSGPCQGREFKGPTASILSSTKWDHSKFIGGVAVNMKFSKSSMGENYANTLTSLIKAFIMRGGFEIQINVVDSEILKQAVQNPENYKDLVVRIGGYSDYFTRLSPDMQQEVILRTEHRL